MSPNTSTSTSLLLIHPAGLSLAPFPSRAKDLSAEALTPVNLPFPSRFPPSAVPRLALAGGGQTQTSSSSSSSSASASASHAHAFLYYTGGHVVWEYDHRGRRISEFSTGGAAGINNKVGSRSERGGIVDVVGLGKVRGKETVVVACDNDSGWLEVWEKGDGGKWGLINRLEGPEKGIAGLATSPDNSLVAAFSTDEVVVYDQQAGSRAAYPLRGRLTEPITKIAFAPSLPSSLVVLTRTSLDLFHLTTSSSATSTADTLRSLRPFSTARPLLDISFSPVVDSLGGKKGGLCAVLGEGGEVALLGLDHPDSAGKIVSYGTSLRCVQFLDGVLLAGVSEDGSLLVKDLRALGQDPVEPKTDLPIIGLRVISQLAKAPRPSLAVAPPTSSTVRTDRSSRTTTTILGEARNACNFETPLPVISRPSPALKAKAALDHKDQQPTQQQETRNATTGQPRKSVVIDETQARVVSAPTATTSSPKRAARHSNTARSTSGPPTHARPSQAQGQPQLRSALVTRSEAIQPIREEDQEQETPSASGSHLDHDLEEGMSRLHEHSLDLGWALQDRNQDRPLSSMIRPTTGSAGAESATMEEMRREIGNLQLDLLRMGRGLKNEIRRAVQPLMEELRDNRQVIEWQKREIDRLRRGY